MHDIAEFFYLVDVLQFHNITSHVCFRLISFFTLRAVYAISGKNARRKIYEINKNKRMKLLDMNKN